jgi:MATE family multidrug resistance protein
MNSNSYSSHFKSTFLLAYPVVISQVGHMVVNITDTIFIGHLGAVKLAACSLGISIFAVFMVLGIGISYGLTPLIAQAFGAKDNTHCGKFLINALALNILTGILIAAGIYVMGNHLDIFGQEKMVIEQAKPFLQIIGASMIPLMVFLSFKQFAEGLSFTRQAMVITLLADGFNVLLTYGLINGKFGLPRMELVGAGIANFISRTLMALLMMYYVLNSKNVKPYIKSFALKYINIADFKAIFTLGLPSAFQYLFEVGAFSVAAIMMGWFGAAYQSAHQIAINIAATTYMASTGIAAATSVRVGNSLGEKNYPKLMRAGMTGYFMVLIFMGSTALLLLASNRILPSYYINDAMVTQIASQLLIIAAFFQLSDGVQVIGLNALRGMTDVKIPTLITFISYWVIAIPLSYYLGFYTGLKANGIWIGLSAGLTISAVLLYFRFRKSAKRLIFANTHLTEAII